MALLNDKMTDAALFHIVSQWFPSGTLFSSTNKTLSELFEQQFKIGNVLKQIEEELFVCDFRIVYIFINRKLCKGIKYNFNIHVCIIVYLQKLNTYKSH
jgi:hypothetical protein